MSNSTAPINEYTGESYEIVYDGTGDTCDGDEDWLGDCDHREDAADHNCGHDEDIYLECTYTYDYEEEE